MTTHSDDNVVYVDFAAAKRADTSTSMSDGATPVQQPPVAPVANRWLDEACECLMLAVEMETDSGRAARGVEYAKQGQVLNCAVEPNVIRGEVRGAGVRAYHVVIRLEPLADADRERAHAYLDAHPDLWTALSRGEMDRRLAYLLGLTISPGVEVDCDCPDYYEVCKHAVALVHTAVALMRTSPASFPLLRGFIADGNGAGAELSTSVPEEPEDSEDASTPELSEAEQRAAVEEATRRFWAGGELPELPSLEVEPMLDDSDMSLLHEAIRSISYTTLDELRVVSEIEDMYYALTHDSQLPPPMED